MLTKQIRISNDEKDCFVFISGQLTFGFSERDISVRFLHVYPSQLYELREIVLKGKNSQTVAIASEGIATHGDPLQDAPLLLNVYEKIYGNDDDEKIELAISKLTGLTLPEGSPPGNWKMNWNHMADKGSYYSQGSQ